MNNRNLSEIEDGREPSGGEIAVAVVFTAIVVWCILALLASCAWRAQVEAARRFRREVQPEAIAVECAVKPTPT